MILILRKKCNFSEWGHFLQFLILNSYIHHRMKNWQRSSSICFMVYHIADDTHHLARVKKKSKKWGQNGRWNVCILKLALKKLNCNFNDTPVIFCSSCCCRHLCLSRQTSEVNEALTQHKFKKHNLQKVDLAK